MNSSGVEFQKLNMEVQEKLDFALSKFQKMKAERDSALRMLQKYERMRSRSLEGISEAVEEEEEEEERHGGGYDDDGDRAARTRFKQRTGSHRNYKDGGGDGDDDDDDDGEEEEEDDDEEGDEYVWEIFNVVLNQQTSDQGFGLSLRGGRDDPYFSNGDPTVVVAQVAESSPADGKLRVGDQLLSLNSISLESIDRGTVLSMLRESGHSVNLVVRRRVLLPGRKLDHPLRVTLARKNKKEEFGLIIDCKIFVRSVVPNSPADLEGNIRPGDTILEVQNLPVDSLSFNDILKHIEKCKDKLKLLINKRTKKLPEGKKKRVSHTRKSSLPVPKLPSGNPTSESSRDPVKHSKSEGPRLVSLKREGGRGITVVGGNKTGIFVRRVEEGSEAQQLGLAEGDMILKVNDTELFGKTREEAVLLLLPGASQGDAMSLLVQRRRRDYERLLSDSGSSSSGDLFYVRSNFSCEGSDHGWLAVQKGDVFQVVDTIPEGVLGSWRAVKVTGSEVKGDESRGMRRGIIPNMNRAQQMALSSLLYKDQSQAKKSGPNLFKKARPKSGIISGSLSPQVSDSVLQPPYDRVSFRNVAQRRPVVLCGPLADAVERRLVSERPEKFELPGAADRECPFVRYADVQAVAAKGKYSLLGIDCIERLRKSGLPPIVVCFRADSKQVVRDVIQSWDRACPNPPLPSSSTSPSAPAPSSSSLVWKSPKKIFERFQDFEKQHSHLFTCVVPLSANETWMKELEEKVNELQREKVWTNEVTDSISDDEIIHIKSSDLSSFISDARPRTGALESDGGGESTLTRSTSDPNLLKPLGTAIRYLPSYSTATSLKARKKPPPPERQRGRAKVADEDRRHQDLDRDRHQDLDIPQLRRPSTEKLAPNKHHFSNKIDSHNSNANNNNSNIGSNNTNDNSQAEHALKSWQGGSLNHDRQVPNPYYPVFAPRASPSDRAGPRTSPADCSAPRLGPPPLPLHTRQMSADPRQGFHGDNSGNTSSIVNGICRQQPTYRWIEGPSGMEGRHHASRKSWHEERVLAPGELSLTGQTEIPIGPSDSGIRRMSHDTRVQGPASHQRSSSSSAFRPNGIIHRPLQPSITSPVPGAVSLRPGNGKVTTLNPGLDGPRRLQELVTEQGRNFGTGNSSNSYNSSNSNNSGIVIAQAKGTFDSGGGILDSKETGVKIVIPRGALPQGVEQEIYFKVCKDSNNITPLDKVKGETLLSPLVMCGPRGLQFLRPVELHIPHSTSIDPETWSFSVKSTNSPDGDPKNWHQVHLEPNNNNNRNDNFLARAQNTVSFLVERF